MIFSDNSIDKDLTEDEGGVFKLENGNLGYSLYINPLGMTTEIILTEKELKFMLKEIKKYK